MADMSLVRVLPSAEDEVNAAAFHPCPVRISWCSRVRTMSDRGHPSDNQLSIQRLPLCCLLCRARAARKDLIRQFAVACFAAGWRPGVRHQGRPAAAAAHRARRPAAGA